jgi:tetratricopeptide (TPR) repeat protein
MNLSKIEQMVIDGDLSNEALIYLIGCRGECEWLDYKEHLHLEHDKELCDFTKDMLGMKNVGGGFVVVGVRDKTWTSVGITKALPYDAKQLRDKVRHASGVDLDIQIVHHNLYIDGFDKLFALIHVRASKKRRKRRDPTLVGRNFCAGQAFGLRSGEIYVRKGDSTIRLTSDSELRELIDTLEEQADRNALEAACDTSPFAVEDGTYRLLEKGFDRFIGRQAIRQQIQGALTKDPRIWIINVHGPGGVGKSALVNWVTYEYYRNRTFEAIIHLSGKETVLTPQGIRRYGRSLYALDDLLERIIETFLEPIPADIQSKQSLATEILSAYQTLLVLDNMETVNDGRILTFVQGLPPQCKSKVLMTSRTKTGGWELAIPVIELSLPEVEEFVRIKSMELNVAFPCDRKTCERVLETSGGLPLAIQWLIGRYKYTCDLNGVLNQVRLPDSPVLEFSFRNIWAMLSGDARSVLAVMTIFESPPTLQNLTVALGWPVERIEKALSELAEVTLVNRIIRQQDGVTQYVALPITLSFAQHQFDTMGDLETECRKRVNKFEDQMSLQQSEVRRFAGTFERYGLQSDQERKASILCSRGQSEMFSGNTENADTLFKQARDLAPLSAYVLAMSASYELVRNRVGIATDLAKAACRLADKKTGALAYTILARVYEVQHDRLATVESLKKAVTFDSTNTVICHQYGVALSRAGKSAEAIVEFTKIIEQEKLRVPSRDSLLMALKTRVINYRRLGMESDAKKDLEFAAEVLKNNPHLQGQARHILELMDNTDDT